MNAHRQPDLFRLLVRLREDGEVGRLSGPALAVTLAIAARPCPTCRPPLAEEDRLRQRLGETSASYTDLDALAEQLAEARCTPEDVGWIAHAVPRAEQAEALAVLATVRRLVLTGN